MSIYDRKEMDQKENDMGRGGDQITSSAAASIDAIDDAGRDADVDANMFDGDSIEKSKLERALVRTIDWRLCTIGGILCSLNLLDSGIISSASVTSIFEDLGLGEGNRYVSVSIR